LLTFKGGQESQQAPCFVESGWLFFNGSRWG